MENQKLTIEQVVEIYGISMELLKELARQGVGPKYQIDPETGRILYSAPDIESWLAEGEAND